MSKIASVLHNFLKTPKDNGLFVFESFTGSGKSYAFYECAKELLRVGENKKIFYITNLKNNLPNDEILKEKFGDNASKCLRVYSKKDYVDDFINKQKHKDIADDDIAGKEFKLLFEKIEEKNKQKSKFKDDISVAKKLDEEIDEYIDKIIKKMENTAKVKGLSPKERIEKLKKENRWFIECFLNIEMLNYQVYFMTMDKFFAINRTIVEEPYDFITNDITKGAIIFIDEFDKAKDIWLNSLLNSTRNPTINIMQVFTRLKNGLLNNLAFKHNEESLEKLRIRAEELEKEFNLKNSFKYIAKDNAYTRVLFGGSSTLVMIGGEKKYLGVKCNKHQNEINTYKSKDEILKAGAYPLNTLLNRLEAYISSVAKFIYYSAKMNLTSGGSRYSELSIINTLIHSDKDDKMPEYILNRVYNENDINRLITFSKSDTTIKDFSFWANGFSATYLDDDESHEYDTYFSKYQIKITPERGLLYLSNKAKVIGLSATAKNNSVISNFALDYIKDKLGEDYYELSKEEEQILQDNYAELYKNYNVNIDVKSVYAVCDVQPLELCIASNDDIKFLKDCDNIVDIAVFNDLKDMSQTLNFDLKETYKRIHEAYNINIKDQNNYYLKQLIKLLKAICEFKQADSKAGIFFLPRKLNKENLYNEEFISKILEKNQIDCFVVDSKSFDEKFKHIQEALKNNRKVALFTTYQSMAQGYNIQYEFNQNEKIVRINDRQEGKKDWNFIYLERPTNIANYDNKDDELDDITRKYKFIYNIFALYEHGGITWEEKKNTIKKLLDKEAFSKQAPLCTDVIEAIKVILEQTIGRVCRTSNKNKNIYIIYDDDILGRNITRIPCGERVTPEFKKFYDELHKKARNTKNAPEPFEKYQNLNVEKHIWANKIIDSLVRFKGNENNIKSYQDLRETLMKYPVLKTKNEIDYNFAQFFLEFEEPTSSYEVRKNAENEEIKIPPSGNYDAQYILPQNIFIAITGLQDHFIKKGYATQIEPSKFWMPERFIQVYHGKLGEEIVNFIFKKYLDFELKEISNIEYFEFFDFLLEYNDEIIAVDAKFWRREPKENKLDNIENKLEFLGLSRAIIINSRPNEKHANNEPHLDKKNKNILLIDNIYEKKDEKFCLNTKILNKIRTFIEKGHL